MSTTMRRGLVGALPLLAAALVAPVATSGQASGGEGDADGMVEVAVSHLLTHPRFANKRAVLDRNETRGVSQEAVTAGRFAGIAVVHRNDVIACEGNEVPRRCQLTGGADALVGLLGLEIGDGTGYVDLRITQEASFRNRPLIHEQAFRLHMVRAPEGWTVQRTETLWVS